MHSLLTRNRAEAWRHVNPKPTPAELAAFVTQHPRVLPVGLPTAPAQPTTSLLYRLALKALAVIGLVALVLVAALAFVLLGEERPERVRPELTPQQRAQAFRLPQS